MNIWLWNIDGMILTGETEVLAESPVAVPLSGPQFGTQNSHWTVMSCWTHDCISESLYKAGIQLPVYAKQIQKQEIRQVLLKSFNESRQLLCRYSSTFDPSSPAGR
jgi:hypothetical protein